MVKYIFSFDEKHPQIPHRPVVDFNVAIILPLAFTNAIFVDAERHGAKWLKEWKEEQSRYRLVVNRLKTKNLVIWNPNKKP